MPVCQAFIVMGRFLQTIIILLLLFCSTAVAQDHSNDKVASSPKPGWGDFVVVEEKVEPPWWQHLLLWFPNRFLDFVDIFRVDVGAGPAFGGVVRVTKYAQAGYRMMTPGSLRVGDFGRDYPVMLETSNEFGISPAFVKSKDRHICKGELGAGVDLFIVGAYGGICVEEVVDFVGGLFFLDIMDDDFKAD